MVQWVQEDLESRSEIPWNHVYLQASLDRHFYSSQHTSRFSFLKMTNWRRRKGKGVMEQKIIIISSRSPNYQSLRFQTLKKSFLFLDFLIPNNHTEFMESKNEICLFGNLCDLENAK